MAVTVLYLVRHAQPEPGEDVSDPALSDLGRRQAAALGGRLRRVPVTALHHGPSSRTTQTAEHLAAAVPGIVPQVSDHLRDRTPVPLPAQQSAFSERRLAWFRAVPPGESDPDGMAIDAAVDHFATVMPSDQHVVLVTHSFVIGWFVRRALQLPWDGWMTLQPVPSALTVIAVRDAPRLAVVAYNDGGHLTGGLRSDDPLHLGV